MSSLSVVWVKCKARLFCITTFLSFWHYGQQCMWCFQSAPLACTSTDLSRQWTESATLSLNLKPWFQHRTGSFLKGWHSPIFVLRIIAGLFYRWETCIWSRYQTSIYRIWHEAAYCFKSQHVGMAWPFWHCGRPTPTKLWVRHLTPDWSHVWNLTGLSRGPTF